MTDTTQQEGGVTPPPEAEDGSKGKSAHTFVKDSDLFLVVIVTAIVLLLILAFGAVLFRSGLFSFPDMAVRGGQSTPDLQAYFADGLAYRERRTALALLLRTFLTAFSFIFGLALCTMGGIFILRQVTALTTLSRNLPAARPVDENQVSDGPSNNLLESIKGQFAFSTYSPGVAFMAGGIAVIFVTQFYSLPITTVETLHPVGVNWCVDRNKGIYDLCVNLSDQYPSDKTDRGNSADMAQNRSGRDRQNDPGPVNFCDLPKDKRPPPDTCDR